MKSTGQRRWAVSVVPRPAPAGAAMPWPAAAAVLALSGALGAGDAAPVCGHVRDLLAGHEAGLVVCDLSGLAGAGLAAVDVLARLQLTVRRLGHRIQFWNVPRELLELLVLSGLDQALPAAAGPGSPPAGPPVPPAAQRQEQERMP
jgi:ABC-type transporter Mla MlaB component